MLDTAFRGLSSQFLRTKSRLNEKKRNHSQIVCCIDKTPQQVCKNYAHFLKNFESLQVQGLTCTESWKTKVTRIVVSKDNKHIYSSSLDGVIKVLEFETKKEIYCFKNIHTRRIHLSYKDLTVKEEKYRQAMELYALRETSTSDPDLHEVEVFYLEEILQKGKGCTRLLKASSGEMEEPVAIKLYPKSQTGHCCLGFMNEESTITKLSHPNLVKYYSFYRDALIKGKDGNLNQYSAIVMEYIASGDLFKLVSRGPLSEKLARTMFKQMVAVIEYLHSQKVAHLDLKLENFLFTGDEIKLIDFDGCRSLDAKCPEDTRLGTVGYRPPEFVNGCYQDLRAADIYSLGIVLFMMVTGTPPYTEILENKTQKFDQYYEALRKDTAKFWRVHEHYRTVDHKEPFSKEFKQLIEGMLAEKPQDRYKVEDIKKAKWFEEKTFTSDELKRGLSCHY